MVRQNTESAIDRGPSKLDLMLALFDTDMGIRTLQFQIGNMYRNIDPRRKTERVDVQITSAKRRHVSAKIWDITGIVQTQHGKERVSIYYLSDTREGVLRFEGEKLSRDSASTMDALKANALWLAIEKMIRRYRDNHSDDLDEEMFRLFEKAKVVDQAENQKTLIAAVENLKS